MLNIIGHYENAILSLSEISPLIYLLSQKTKQNGWTNQVQVRIQSNQNPRTCEMVAFLETISMKHTLYKI